MWFYSEPLGSPCAPSGRACTEDSMNVQRERRFLFCFALYKERSLTKRKQQETRGKAKGKRQKRAFGRQNSFGCLTISQLNGWPGNNPPPKKRDVTIAVQVPGLQADTSLTCPTELHQPTHTRPFVHICICLLDLSVKLGSLWSGNHLFTDVWTKYSTIRLWSFWTSGSPNYSSIFSLCYTVRFWTPSPLFLVLEVRLLPEMDSPCSPYLTCLERGRKQKVFSLFNGPYSIFLK